MGKRIELNLKSKQKKIKMGNCILFHSWGRWERRTNCEYVRYCKECGAEKIKYKHNWGDWFYEAENSCKLIRECRICGEIDVGTYRHVWTDWHYESTNSCRQIRNCSRCGNVEEGEIVHQMSIWKYKNDKQCDVYRTCKRCDYTQNDMAHKWGNWGYKSETDCTQIRICERCKGTEIGECKHDWGKTKFFKATCRRCKTKKKISGYFSPINWIIQLRRMIGEQNRNAIIKDIIAGKALEKSLNRSFKESMAFLRENLFLDLLIIDSNIWMNDTPQYNRFISIFPYLLKSFNTRYIFYGPQFEEICNIKKKSDYCESRNKRSRLAINRIDKLSKENLLSITPIKLELKNPGHVDPLLIKLLLMSAKKGQSTILLTDDNELRIRAREKLKEYNIKNYRIFKMDDLMVYFNTINMAMKEGIANKNAQHSVKKNVIYLSQKLTSQIPSTTNLVSPKINRSNSLKLFLETLKIHWKTTRTS